MAVCRRDSIGVVSDGEKGLAAEAAAELVEDGMRVGLGTGSTVAFLLPALARRGLDFRCVATSPATERAATELGLPNRFALYRLLKKHGLARPGRR